MSEFPQATSVADSKNRVLRWARCPLPTHKDALGRGTRCSVFVGPQQREDGQVLWAFECSYLGRSHRHIFAALPDETEPKNLEDFPAWLQQQAILKEQKKEEWERKQLK